MNFTAGIFGRANIQQIRSFLKDNVSKDKVSADTCDERLKAAEKRMKEVLREKYPDSFECENVLNEVDYYTMQAEDVYMEIGIQCGFILAAQMMANLPVRGDIEDGTI